MKQLDLFPEYKQSNACAQTAALEEPVGTAAEGVRETEQQGDGKKSQSIKLPPIISMHWPEWVVMD